MLKNSNPAQIFWRFFFYIIGMLIIAFGVAFAVNSNLGTSPVTSFPYAIYLALNFNGITKLTLGNCVIIVYLAYILLQIIILGKSFKPITLMQIFISTGFGFFVDFAKWTLNGINPSSYFIRFIMLAVSIVLIAFGLCFYLGAKLLPMPFEGLGLVITEKLGKYPYSRIKLVMDCCSALLAVLVCLIFLGRLEGVGIGTVVTALLAGPVMGVFSRFINPLINRLAFDKKS